MHKKRNERLIKIQEKIKDRNLHGMLICQPQNVRWLSGFTGMSDSEREAWLIVLPHAAYLITDSRYLAHARGLQTGFIPLQQKAGKKVADVVSKLFPKDKSSIIGFEPAALTFFEHGHFSKSLPHISFAAHHDFIEEERIVKTNEELEKIKRAAAIADEAFSSIIEIIKPGKTEKEIAHTIEFFIRAHGADDVAWRPLIVAAGKNSAHPHHISSDKKIAAGDLVLLDFGAKVEGYCSDMTRVVFMGKADKKQRQLYQLVLSAQNAAFEALSKTANGAHADRATRRVLQKEGFTLASGQYQHALGHGVGLAIHEKPMLSKRHNSDIKPGMVFSIEPAVYLPGCYGIRIEDLVAYTDSGIEILTHTSKELCEID